MGLVIVGDVWYSKFMNLSKFTSQFLLLLSTHRG